MNKTAAVNKNKLVIAELVKIGQLKRIPKVLFLNIIYFF
jgi:hypothetical protein